MVADTLSGSIKPTNPSIPKKLKTLLPSTFPTAIAGSRLTAATSDVASSGSDVPAATIVNPTTVRLSPASAAISTAPFTASWAPPTSSARPAATCAALFPTARTCARPTANSPAVT